MKTDEEIIQEAIDGQTNSFGELVARYQAAVVALAFHLTRDFEQARDLAQEAFLKSYSKLHTLRDWGKFAPWLNEITRTTCLNWLKLHQKEQHLDLPAREPQTPHEVLESDLMRQRILAALDHLSKPNQLAMTLYYMDGLSYQEIADFQDVPVTTVRSRLYESRKRLRKELITMVDDVLKSEAPDAEFTRQVMQVLGVVTDAHTGDPIPGAHVRISKVGETTTDSDGSYRINSSEECAGESRIWVDADSYARQSARVMLSQGEAIDGLDIELERGAKLTGRVLDPAGQGLQGVKVQVWATSIRTETDADGRFMLSGLVASPTPYHVRIGDRSFEPFSASVQVVGPEAICLPDVTLRPAATDNMVTGTVQDADGRPIVGATVYIGGNKGGVLNGRYDTTDAHGRYRLAGPAEPEGKAVVVHTPEHAPSLHQLPKECTDFVLYPGRTLRGKVLDEQGNPLKRAWVGVDWHRYNIGRNKDVDADGTFCIEHLPEGTVSFHAVREGFITHREEIQICSGSEATTLPPICLKPKGVVWGKVLDAESGEPVRCFRIRLDFCKELQEGDLPTPSLPATFTREGHALYSQQGEFEIRDLNPGEAVALIAMADGYAPVQLGRVLAQESKQEPILVHLQPSRSVQGIVLDAETSEPIEGTTLFLFDDRRPIMLEFPGGQRIREIGRVHSDSDGQFTIGQAGVHYLYISQAGYAPAFAAVHPEHHEGQALEIRLQRSGHIVGHALPQQGIDFGFYLDPFHYRLSTTADGEGRFQFDGLPVGQSCSVSTRSMGPYRGSRSHSVSDRATSFSLEPRQELELDFRRKGSIRMHGKVPNADGNHLDNVAIFLRNSESLQPQEMLERSRGVVSDPDGGYELTGLLPGSYRIQASSFPEKDEARFRFNGTIELAEGQDTVEHDIVLAPEKLRGREAEARPARPSHLPMSVVDISASPRVERFASTETAGSIWVLDNSHKPYDDDENRNTLTKLSPTGEPLLRAAHFNVCQHSGAGKLMAIEPRTGDCWVCNIRRLTRINVDATELVEIPFLDLGSGITFDEYDDSAVVLLSTAEIPGGGLLRFDPTDGRVIQVLEGAGGLSLDIDPNDRCLWIAGHSIHKVNWQGEVLFSLENLIGWSALDVAIDPSDGCAWFAEGQHPQKLKSRNRLLKLSPDGDLLCAIELEHRPSSVVVDGATREVWVGTLGAVLKYSTDGELLMSIPTRGFCIRLDPHNGGCWASNPDGVYRYSSDGELLTTSTEFSDDQKWLALCPSLA